MHIIMSRSSLGPTSFIFSINRRDTTFSEMFTKFFRYFQNRSVAKKGDINKLAILFYINSKV